MDATPLADDDPPTDVPTLQGMVRKLRGRVAELQAQVITLEAKVADLQGKRDALLKHRPSSEPSAAPPTITTDTRRRLGNPRAKHRPPRRDSPDSYATTLAHFSLYRSDEKTPGIP